MSPFGKLLLLVFLEIYRTLPNKVSKKSLKKDTMLFLLPQAEHPQVLRVQS